MENRIEMKKKVAQETAASNIEEVLLFLMAGLENENEPVKDSIDDEIFHVISKI